MPKIKPWYTRLYDYFVDYDEETPALIVATPLVQGKAPPKPFAIVVPIKHVTGEITLPVVAVAKKKAPAKKRPTVRRKPTSRNYPR